MKFVLALFVPVFVTSHAFANGPTAFELADYVSTACEVKVSTNEELQALCSPQMMEIIRSEFTDEAPVILRTSGTTIIIKGPEMPSKEIRPPKSKSGVPLIRLPLSQDPNVVLTPGLIWIK